MVSDGGLGHGDTQGVGAWKDEDGSAFGHVTASSKQGQEEKRSQRFEKLQEKMKDLGVAWMCAAEEKSQAKKPPRLNDFLQ